MIVQDVKESFNSIISSSLSFQSNMDYYIKHCNLVEMSFDEQCQYVLLKTCGELNSKNTIEYRIFAEIFSKLLDIYLDTSLNDSDEIDITKFIESDIITNKLLLEMFMQRKKLEGSLLSEIDYEITVDEISNTVYSFLSDDIISCFDPRGSDILWNQRLCCNLFWVRRLIRPVVFELVSGKYSIDEYVNIDFVKECINRILCLKSLVKKRYVKLVKKLEHNVEYMDRCLLFDIDPLEDFKCLSYSDFSIVDGLLTIINNQEFYSENFKCEKLGFRIL